MASKSPTPPLSTQNTQIDIETAHKSCISTKATHAIASNSPLNDDSTSIIESTSIKEICKDKLNHLLTKRPPREQLVNLNILRAFDQDPALQQVMSNLIKQRLRHFFSSQILNKKLSKRKSIQSLIREGILKEVDEDDSNKKDMFKRMSHHTINEFLSRRPSLHELVKANMVQDVMQWTKISCTGTIPRERNCHSICLNRDETMIYMLGGFNTGSVGIDLLKFDIENKRWSRPLIGGQVPNERYCHSVVNVDSNLIVFGGFGVQDGKWLNDLHALDTEYAMNSKFEAFVPRLSAYGQCKASTNNSQMLLWYQPETTGNAPSARAAHAACVVGHKMFIFGGNLGETLCNELYCLDTKIMKWSKVVTQGKSPSPRMYHTMTYIANRYLLVFGGCDANEHGVYEPLNDLYIFDLKDNTWKQPSINGTAPSPRAAHSAVSLQNGKQLLIFGGGGVKDKMLNDLHILDIGNGLKKSMTWIRPSDSGMLPCPRASHACCCSKRSNVVYIFGGGDIVGEKLFNDLYQLDTGYFTTDDKNISKLIYANVQNERIALPANMAGRDLLCVPTAVDDEKLMDNVVPNYAYNSAQQMYGNHDDDDDDDDDDAKHGYESVQSNKNDVRKSGNDAMGDHGNVNKQVNAEEMESPLWKAGLISDCIQESTQEIDILIGTVESGIQKKINQFRQKEQGYIMILRSIEAERGKLIDDVNKDISMLKFSVKESMDKLQQQFIAKMLRKHVDFVNNGNNTNSYTNQQQPIPQISVSKPQPQVKPQVQHRAEPRKVVKKKLVKKKRKKSIVKQPLLAKIDEGNEEQTNVVFPIVSKSETQPKQQQRKGCENNNNITTQPLAIPPLRTLPLPRMTQTALPSASTLINQTIMNATNPLQTTPSPSPPQSVSPPLQHQVRTKGTIESALNMQAQIQLHQMMAQQYAAMQQMQHQKRTQYAQQNYHILQQQTANQNSLYQTPIATANAATNPNFMQQFQMLQPNLYPQIQTQFTNQYTTPHVQSLRKKKRRKRRKKRRKSQSPINPMNVNDHTMIPNMNMNTNALPPFHTHSYMQQQFNGNPIINLHSSFTDV